VHSAPVVRMNAWVKVGSVPRARKRKGNHPLHRATLLFKGTEKLKVGELDKRIKAPGIHNAPYPLLKATTSLTLLPSR